MIRSLCGCLKREDGLETEEQWQERLNAHHVLCCQERQRIGELGECLQGDCHNCPQVTERDYSFS